MGYYIGMDAGGTYARIKIADKSGAEIYTSQGEGGTISASGYEAVRARFHVLIHNALSACSLLPSDCLRFCLGAAGIDSDTLRAQYINILTDIGFQYDSIVAYNDCELLLELFDESCVVLIAGTGSIAMGRRKAEDRLLRCGGWSYLIGDEGSAVAISLSAMRAALKHWDGQTLCPVLTTRVAERLRLDSPQELAAWCHKNIVKKELLACAAPMVEEAAVQGDTIANQILLDAADGLYALAERIITRMSVKNERFSVLLWGSVLVQNRFVRDAVCKHLLNKYPQANVCMLSSSALDCALTLAQGRPASDLVIPLQKNRCVV